MKKSNPKAKKSFIVPFYLMLGLLFTSVFTVFQLNQKQIFQSRAFTNCDVSQADLVESATEKAMFDQINAYRQQNAVPPLSLTATLKRPAKWLSNDASKTNSGSQTDSLGRDTLKRAADCGAPLPEFWGELVGIGSIDQAMAALKASSKDTLLDTNVSKIAIGQTGNYWGIITANIIGDPTDPVTTDPVTTDPGTTTNVSPTFGAISDCTTTNTCPTTQPGAQDPVVSEPVVDDPAAPVVDEPATDEPCPQVSAAYDHHHGHGGDKNSNGGLVQVLLILLQLLLQLLGQGNAGGAAPHPTPCPPSPAPSI
jgi:hypothetical protein